MSKDNERHEKQIEKQTNSGYTMNELDEIILHKAAQKLQDAINEII